MTHNVENLVVEFNQAYLKCKQRHPQTILFEVLSSINTIVYRYLNDGDYFWDYQHMTVNFAAAYLLRLNQRQHYAEEAAQWVQSNIDVQYDEQQLARLLLIGIDYAKYNEFLFATGLCFIDEVVRDYAREQFRQYSISREDEDEDEDEDY